MGAVIIECLLQVESAEKEKKELGLRARGAFRDVRSLANVGGSVEMGLSWLLGPSRVPKLCVLLFVLFGEDSKRTYLG